MVMEPTDDAPVVDKSVVNGDDSTTEHEMVDVRFSYANERTFLAWNRTSLALVTAGLAITQLLPPFSVPGGRRMIGVPLIVLGIVIALSSLWQWRRNEEAMEERRNLPKSPLPFFVAIVIGITAIVALGLVLFAGNTT